MTRDDRLRTELDALERSAPDAAPPIADARRSRRWALGLVAGTVIGAAALTAVAVGPLRSLPLGTVSPSPNPPATAETRVGEFILTISSPKTEWTSEEAIEVLASLKYVGDESDMTIGQGIPPVMFTVASASGEGPTLGGAQLQPCAQYPVSAEEPVVVGMQTGGFLAVEDGRLVEPRPPYDRIIADDAGLHLPPGDWILTAYTDFNERGCGGDYELQVSIVLRVVTAEGLPPSAYSQGPTPTIEPSPPSSPRPSARVCATGLASGVLGADADGNPLLQMTDKASPVLIVWSYPDTYRVDSSDVLTIYDREGNLVAREGDWIVLGGGFTADDTVFTACGVTREPTETPAPFDNDPPSVTGVLVGDPQLEIGCIWIRDDDGHAWEIRWPEGYEDGFRNGVAVLLREGEIAATEGDVITVSGQRSRAQGSWCMVGIIYEAAEVDIEAEGLPFVRCPTDHPSATVRPNGWEDPPCD